MPVKTFYLLDTLTANSQFYDVQEGGTAPTAALFAVKTGWNSGGPNAATSSDLDSNAFRAAATFTTTLGPGAPDNVLGNGWRLPLITGIYDAGNWTFSIGSRSTSGTTQFFGRMRYRWRVFKSTDPTGQTGLTELTGAVVVTAATTANLSTSSPGTVLSVTWAAPQITLNNEYIFILLAQEITTRDSFTSDDVLLTKSSSSAFTTANFVPVGRFLDAPSLDVGVELGTPFVGRFLDAGSIDVGVELGNFGTSPVLTPPSIDIVVEQGVPQQVVRGNVNITMNVGVDVGVDFGVPKIIMYLAETTAVEVGIDIGTPRLISTKSKTELIMDEYERERQMLMGARGTLRFKPILFLSDVYANELTELPGVLGASVNLDNNRDYTWELKLDCLPTDAFDPIRDWVLVALDVSCDLDPPTRYYLGLYRFDFPRGSDEPEGSVWNLTGMSPEFMLMRDDINELFPVAGGSMILQLIRNIITTRAFLPSTRLTMPWSEDLALPFASMFGGGTNDDVKTWLDLVNKLLSAGGFHHLQSDNVGQPVARKIRLPASSPPSVFYGPRERTIGGFKGNDMIAYSAISREPDYSKFANEYTVISAENEQQGSTTTGGVKIPPARATVRNNDPKNPISIANLGYVMSKEETLDQAVNILVCRLIAQRRLMEASSFYNKRQMYTMLDPRRTYDEIYLCEATNAQGVMIMDERWQALNWNIPLPVGGAPDVMTHSVGRDEPITELEFS